MNISLNAVKIAAIALAVIIFVLLGVLIFWNPAVGPTKISTPPTGDVTISMPIAGALITSPVGIEGQALGTWFFEASFPVKILDGDGRVLGQGPAQALGEWMTTSTVPFSANIPFMTPKYATGTIVFANDNPSGSPANQKQFTVEVRFK